MHLRDHVATAMERLAQAKETLGFAVLEIRAAYADALRDPKLAAGPGESREDAASRVAISVTLTGSLGSRPGKVEGSVLDSLEQDLWTALAALADARGLITPAAQETTP